MKFCVSTLVRFPHISIGLLAASLAMATLADAAPSNSPWGKKSSYGSSDPRLNTSSNTPRRSIESIEYSRDVSPFGPDSHNLSLDLGQVFLLGDLGNNYGNSLGVQAHYNYGVSELFAFDAALGYSSHSSGDFSMTNLRAGMRMNLSWYDKIVPHLSFGLGFYKPSMQYSLTNSANGQTTASVSPLVFGIYLGPGVDLMISQNMFFGASLTFNDLFGTTTTTADGKILDVDGTYSQFFLRIGMTF